jgi:Ca2+-binding EF-hand superfamily protein
MKTHIFAAAGFLALSFVGEAAAAGPATPEPQDRSQVQRGNMRFRGMDTDGDGRITRAEWRGGERSFRNHDWNNDGVLSGDEVRLGVARSRNQNQDDPGFYDWTLAGFRSLDLNRDNRITRSEWQYDPELFLRADRNRDNILTRAEFLGSDTTDIDREDRFDDLDTNNNGVIERAEWHGTRDAFEWLDRNNDGRLNRAETVDNEVATGTSGRAQISERVVDVDSQTRWTDTGITVRAGDILRLQAEGTVTLSGPDDIADPAGAQSGRRAPNSLLPQMPAGGLIGRIGDSAPFYIGDRDTLDRATRSGRLYLGVNDDHLPDNTGRFRVTIAVER